MRSPHATMREEPPLTTTRESPHAATKTQCSQKQKAKKKKQKKLIYKSNIANLKSMLQFHFMVCEGTNISREHICIEELVSVYVEIGMCASVDSLLKFSWVYFKSRRDCTMNRFHKTMAYDLQM